VNTRTANGQFRRLSQTEKILRDANKGLSVLQVARKRKVRYQTVWRAFHRFGLATNS